MGRAEIVTSKAKCPKCKSKDLFLCEEWRGHTIVWEQIDGRFDYNDGNLEPGDPWRLSATCKGCGHAWKMGNVQISHVITTNTSTNK